MQRDAEPGPFEHGNAYGRLIATAMALDPDGFALELLEVGAAP